ncbi:hypothetical protein DM01DRAFT_1170664 [Hesseltinella vesiculosa]|uniref:Uncharacterized protein n=1 Tax=Hesseltinella vesiculosa TaxID=101127 RepID=A0A1X2G5S2_9FUNG|nr:hypothetical protein DM01DRAFT_1170664 [Hesseltinella vesiculosa]
MKWTTSCLFRTSMLLSCPMVHPSQLVAFEQELRRLAGEYHEGYFDDFFFVSVRHGMKKTVPPSLCLNSDLVKIMTNAIDWDGEVLEDPRTKVYVDYGWKFFGGVGETTLWLADYDEEQGVQGRHLRIIGKFLPSPPLAKYTEYPLAGMSHVSGFVLRSMDTVGGDGPMSILKLIGYHTHKSITYKRDDDRVGVDATPLDIFARSRAYESYFELLHSAYELAAHSRCQYPARLEMRICNGSADYSCISERVQ